MIRTTMKRIFIFVLVSLLIGCASVGSPRPTNLNSTDGSPLAAAPVIFFQRFLSRADGHRCPMTPSCSNYALDAIRRHGALIGYIMACDRLMRCGRDELSLSAPLMTHDGPRWQDPVTNNDFWWP